MAVVDGTIELARQFFRSGTRNYGSEHVQNNSSNTQQQQ